jgi:AbrB family looped-hinge helix DNA binding protein
MNVAISRVSKKGLITIPAKIRKRFDIKDGDLISWDIDEENNVIILRVIRDPFKYLEGKYEDPKIVYEKVEETADKLILGELNADH